MTEPDSPPAETKADDHGAMYRDLAGVLGLFLIVGGVALIFPPAALIVAGVLIVACSFLAALRP